MGCTLRNVTKNLHVGEISEGGSDVRLLKRNNTKNSHTGEIGEGDSDVRSVKSECTELQCTVQRVQPDRGHHCGEKRQL